MNDLEKGFDETRPCRLPQQAILPNFFEIPDLPQFPYVFWLLIFEANLPFCICCLFKLIYVFPI